MKLQQLQDEIREWSDKTFGIKRSPIPIAYHLQKEVVELIDALESVYEKNEFDSVFAFNNVIMEHADCMMLLLDSASHFSISAEALLNAVKKKLEINKKRKWGKPDLNGVCEHIRDKQ